MNTFFSALDSAMLGLNDRLATQVGLLEATTGALAREALPMVVQRLGTNAGDPETALALCQKFARAQIYRNLPELTRPDGGWPEQRRYLAQTLLGNDAYAHLLAGHSPEPASELLGYFTLVVLSTAGQQSINQQLDGAGFQQWRHQMAASAAQWRTLDYSTISLIAPDRVVAVGADRTAPWWPLVALAVVGISASSYFWNQQVAEAGHKAMKAMKSAVATVAPIVGFTSAPNTAAVIGDKAPANPAPARMTAPAVPTKPTAFIPAPVASAQLANEPLTTKTVSLQLADTTAAQRQEVKPKALPDKDGEPAATPTSVSPPAGTGSTGMVPAPGRTAESLLYRRLMIDDLRKQQPIPLEQIRFATGQATLDNKGSYQLENIAALLKSFPGCKLTITGYAEASEPASLALDRANAVIAALRKQGVHKPVLLALASVRPEADNAKASDEMHSPTLLVNAVK